MRGRAVGVVEVQTERHGVIDSALQLLRGRNAFKLKLDRAQSGGSDREQELAFLPALRADQQHFGPAKMRQREASEGEAFLQRGRGQMNAPQQLAGRENIRHGCR